MNIDVVDRYDDGGFLATVRQILENEVLVGDAEELVQGVLGRLGGRNELRRLRIFGHGNVGRQAVGGGRQPDEANEWIAVRQPPPAIRGGRACGVYDSGPVSNSETLRRLRGVFERGGWVELHGCNVARGQRGGELLEHLSRLWRVPIKAGLAKQYAGGGLEGPVLVVWPSGRREHRA